MRNATRVLSAQTDDPTQRPLDPADIAAYLDACIVESNGDPHVFAEALCNLADRHALRSMACRAGCRQTWCTGNSPASVRSPSVPSSARCGRWAWNFG